jgi:hypothetical protein
MSGGFSVTPAELRQVSDGLVNVVDRMSEALTKLESDLRGFGSPWGTGAIGQIIGEIYNGVHDMAMGSLEANAEVMSEYAEGLDSMAEDIELLEQVLEEGFGQFEQVLAEGFGPAGP